MDESPSVSRVGEVKASGLKELAAADTVERLEEWRVTYLGRRGQLTQILRGLGSLSQDERGKIGALANEAKRLLEESLNLKEQDLKQAQVAGLLEGDTIDVTLPGWPMPSGGLHPTTRTVREICEVFTSMGFQVVEGPEVELDRYNFEMLNIPKHHPARDMFNTHWIDYTDENGDRPMLLRTHTSPMQTRIMESMKPPVRVVVPGRVFRYEATDATHEWHFFQVEGLAVDEGITFADLKGTLYEFARHLFGQERRVRFRCDYFPFVEPGGGHVHRLLRLRRAGVPHMQRDRMDRDPGRGDGASQGLGGCGLRPQRLHRLCLRHGGGAHRHAQARHRGHPPVLLQRPAIFEAVLK